MNAFTGKEETCQINNLRSPSPALQSRKRKRSPKYAEKKKRIIKIKAEISEIKNHKTTGKISETKSWFFES